MLAHRLPKISFAELPTPLTWRTAKRLSSTHSIAIKQDGVSGQPYGGNKVRKLEYILRRAADRGADNIATFGAAASNHALATSIYAHSLGFSCTCFLAHQVATPAVPVSLARHVNVGSKLIPYGGTRTQRLATLRQHLRPRRSWMIPAGGSSWLGAVGFVNAGLEFAAQIRVAGEAPPDRLYVANGTMATAAGLALGLALAGLETETHAVRVTDLFVSNEPAMQRMLNKVAHMLRRCDPQIPDDLAERARMVFRHEFFGDGYAQTNPDTDAAVEFAREQLGLTLEPTYTGKAMRALLSDLSAADGKQLRVAFWNTYNAIELPVAANGANLTEQLPAEFSRYFD